MANKSIHTFVVLAYKESEFLEDCIKSVTNQKYPSEVIIATTTPNNHITQIADKHKISIIVGKHTNIGGDFDFAKNLAKTELVTIAHQDDIYDFEYSKIIIKNYKLYPDASIIFTDYYEIRNNKKEAANKNLKIKRILLKSLSIKKLCSFTFIKRLPIRFGDAISCPAVSFVSGNVPKNLFASDYKANVDWFAWEKLSKLPGRFVFINKILMGHRIDETTETTKIINSGIRTKEDFDIYTKFWPEPIAKIFTQTYKKSEKSNEL